MHTPHQHCPCTMCSDKEASYNRFMEACEALPLKEWEEWEVMDNIDAYTKEVLVRAEVYGHAIVGTGITVHGELTDVIDIELEQD